MTKAINDQITQFIGYFREQIQAIDALTASSNEAQVADGARSRLRFYKKVLLITAIDTLAGIRYPRILYPHLNGKNRERFTHFLSESNIWPDGSRASIPFIAQHKDSKLVKGGQLEAFVRLRFQRGSSGEEFSVPLQNLDVPLGELLSRAVNEAEQRFASEHQHFVLLYRYRNYLVHESREPGYAMEIGGDQKPHYHGYIGDGRLYLCYPLSHFRTLASASVDYVERYMTANALNPYDYVSDTSTW